MKNNLVMFIKRHQLPAFFVLTYGLSWGLWIPLQQLALQGQALLMPLLSLGIFAPALVSAGLSAILNPNPRQGSRKPAAITFVAVWIFATLIIGLDQVYRQQLRWSGLMVVVSLLTGLLPAFILSSAFSRVPGLKEHVRTYVRPTGAAGYYLMAITLFPAIWLIGNILSRAFGVTTPFFNSLPIGASTFGKILLFFHMNLIYGGISEEPGWRGFALPRLQARFSPFTASLILGILWAVWHAPARLGGFEAKTLEDSIVEWVLIVIVTIIFTWLFNRTSGSLLAVALLHAAMNTTSSFLSGTLGALLLVVAVAAVLVFLDQMWRRQPGSSPSPYQMTEYAS